MDCGTHHLRAHTKSVSTNVVNTNNDLPGSRTDILFSNIKHLFFQPCDYELLVILHIHLKAPIIVGKKKAHVRGYQYTPRDDSNGC